MINFLKSNMTFFYLAVLSFGLTFCASLQLSNLSSIFSFMGASASTIPMLWLAPPLTGLIIQPLIGQISDDTTTRFGKRKPYILLWGILGAISSFIFPFLSSIFFAALISLILNSSLNGGIEAMRALTADLTQRDKETSRAFAIQAVFAGVGGALGTGLPYMIYKFFGRYYMDISLGSNNVPIHLKLSFVITGLMMLLVTFIVLVKVKEKVNKHALLLQKRRTQTSLQKRLYKITRDLVVSFRRIPDQFKKICFIHSLTWSGIFIFWLYFTNAIAQNIYGASMNSVDADQLANLKLATIDSSFYISIYQYVSIFYSCFLYFSNTTNKEIYIHAISLLIGSAGIILLPWEKTPFTIECAMVCFGILWGSIMVLPYSIAVKFLPRGKLGIYLGIFNICITAPQILFSLILPFIYTYLLQSNAAHLLSLGGVFIFSSAVLWTNLIPKKKTAAKELSAQSNA